MTVNRTNDDVGAILNAVETRLGRLERRGRGFSIPPPVDPVTTISSDTPPVPPLAVGTLWFDTDDGSKIYRWSGLAWIPTLDPTVDIARNQASVAIAAWQDDEASADGLVTLYRQASAPGGSPAVGDLWVDTDDGQLYRWSGSGWAAQGDITLGEALAHPALASTVADFRVRTWWQFSEPTPGGFGDLWVKTSDDPPTLWRWNNFNWMQVVDWSFIIQQQELDTKISTYVAPSPPVASVVGDIWYDTSNDNEQHRWDGATWVSVRDGAIADVSTAAANAYTAALAAQSAADAAQATADGAIRTFYETERPWPDNTSQPATSMGDMWFDLDSGQAYRWNGTIWQLIEDNSIAVALAAAQSAQTTADGKITAYYSTTAPVAPQIGDLWFDTSVSGKNKPLYWNGSTWTSVRDGTIGEAQDTADYAVATANTAQTSADAKATTYFQTAQPWANGLTTHAADNGDLWFDTDDGNKMWRWVESTKLWTLSEDQRIPSTLTLAQGKITTFYQDNPPSSTAVGDLWVDTNDGNKLYRANAIGVSAIVTTGTGWYSVQDTNKTTTFFQTSAPSATAVGDIWFKTDEGNKQFRASAVGAGSWVEVSDLNKTKTFTAPSTSIPVATAVGDIWFNTSEKNRQYRAASIGANEIAGGEWVAVDDQRKITSFSQTSPPTATAEGDVWYDTDDGNKAYRAYAAGVNSVGPTGWINVSDKNKTSTFLAPSSAIPVATAVGDLWYNTSDGNKPYIARSIGADAIAVGEWESVQDSSIAAATAAVSAMQTTVALKNSVYRQAATPWPNGEAGHPNGDLWFETDAANKPWIWDSVGQIWVDAADPKLNLLEDIGGLVVDPTTGQTLDSMNESLVNLAETAYSARNLASTADGRVSMSDYDPLPEDVSYYATDRLGNLLLGSSWTITNTTLTANIATLEIGPGFTMTTGDLFIVANTGVPFDGTWKVETYTPLIPEVPATPGPASPEVPAKVTFRVTGQADVASTPTTGTGYNTLLMQRVEGSVWFTRTRARLNFVTNPSFEINTSGWTTPLATSILRIASPGPEDVVAGSFVARVTNSSATGDHRVEWTGGSPGIPVLAGQTFSVTCFALQSSSGTVTANITAPVSPAVGDVWTDTDDGNKAYRWDGTTWVRIGQGCYASVRFYDAGSALLLEATGPATELLTNDWRELKVTATAPTGAAFMAAVVLHNPNPSSVWLIDGALVERAPYTGRYFDGDSYDAAWLGTAEASTSEMAGGKIISVYELYNNGWNRLDFTGTTSYDADASDLTTGTLPSDRIADLSIAIDKIQTNVVRASEKLVAGDLVNIWDNNGLFFVQQASAGIKNLLTNPSFETDLNGWATLSITTATRVADVTAIDGGYVIELTNSATTGTRHSLLVSSIPAVPNRTYTLSAYVKSVSGLLTDFQVYIEFYDSASVYLGTGTGTLTTITTGGWTRLSVSMLAPANAFTMSPRIGSAAVNTSAVWRVDAIQLDESISLLPYRGTAVLQREAHGYCLTAAVAGDVVPVFTFGYNPFGVGLKPGKLYLAVQPGKATNAPPLASGRLLQQVGFASDATTFHFQPQRSLLIV